MVGFCPSFNRSSGREGRFAISPQTSAMIGLQRAMVSGDNPYQEVDQ